MKSQFSLSEGGPQRGNHEFPYEIRVHGEEVVKVLTGKGFTVRMICISLPYQIIRSGNVCLSREGVYRLGPWSRWRVHVN